MHRFILPAGLLALVMLSHAHAADPIDVGSRRELFVDRHLIDKLDGAELHLHRPTPREVVLVTDKPWEGNTSAYYTIFQDGDRYRMYYRGSHYDEKTRKATHPEVACYAESTDGIHWAKPDLGLFDWEDSKANNIVWDGIGTHNFTPFKDANPDCPPEARYKAFGVGSGKAKRGLYAFRSADGVRWELMSKEPVITKGAFDSQNLAFWDPHRKEYREYHRGFRDGVRAIMTGTSRDFLRWTDPVFLEHPDAPKEHLYTNAIRPHPRAPHILVGFPTRFLPPRQQTEPTFMTSRDGRTFHRWTEALIPTTAPKDRDGNRSNYLANGLVELPGAPKEYSLYASEAYYTGPDSRLRRFTVRKDGFVSVRARGRGGLLTKPLTFSGKALEVNFVTEPKGSIRVEVVGSDGKPVEGLSLADCQTLGGDTVGQQVTWKGGDLSRLGGKPVRLRFAIEDADLFSFRFVP